MKQPIKIDAVVRVLVLAPALAWLVWLFIYTLPYVEDDAFIHLHFARSVMGGGGFAFNGQPTYGDSSPLWVGLIALTFVVVGHWVVALKLLAVAGVITCLTGAYYVARRLADQGRLGALLPPVLVLIVSLNPFFSFWAFSGMEAVMALGWAFWFCGLALFGEMSIRRFALLCLMAGLAPLLRAELLLLVLPGLGLGVWRLYRRHLLNNRTLAIAIVGGTVLVVLPVLIWSGYALHAFGTLIPNTNAAKRVLPSGNEVGFVSGAIRLASLIAVGFPIETLLVCVLLAIAAYRRDAYLAAVLVLFWPVMLMAFYMANNTAIQTRYVLIGAPFITLAALVMLHRSGSRLPLKRPGSRHAAAFLAVALGMVIIAGAINFISVLPHLANKVLSIARVSVMTEYIRSQVPADAPIAVYAIGQIGFQTPNPIIDLGGLTMPAAQPYLLDPDKMFEWAKGEGAEYFIGEPLPAAKGRPVYSTRMPFVGWQFSRSAYAEDHEYALSIVR